MSITAIIQSGWKERIPGTIIPDIDQIPHTMIPDIKREQQVLVDILDEETLRQLLNEYHTRGTCMPSAQGTAQGEGGTRETNAVLTSSVDAGLTRTELGVEEDIILRAVWPEVCSA